MSDNLRVVALTVRHAAAWRGLYAGYAGFYCASVPDMEKVWSWISGGQLCGLGAEDTASGQLLGFAHWQKILRPLCGTHTGYLHDLFVHPEARGRGIGKSLIVAAGEQATAAECTLLRWATTADNHPAQKLYDRLANKTSWVIYERRLAN